MVAKPGDCADAYPYDQARMVHKARILELFAAGGARLRDVPSSCVASIIDNAGHIFQAADELLETTDSPDTFDVLRLVPLRDKAITILALVSLAYETANAMQFRDSPADLGDMPVTEVLAALRAG